MQIFFVGGTPKSGTTWVQRALDLHSKIVCSGEGHFQEFIFKPILDMYRAYNIKLTAVAELVYESKPFHQRVSDQDALSTMRQIAERILLRRTGPDTEAVGDKTPGYIYTLRDLDLVFPSMLFIAVMRDPRDAAASRLHHAARTYDPQALDRETTLWTEVVQSSAKGWMNAYERSRNFSRDNPERILFVRYEDLVAEPVVHFERVFDFLKVATEPGEVEAIAWQSRFEAFSGRKPGVEDRSSFYRKGITGDWRNVLDDASEAAIRAVCADGMRAFGYT